MPEELKREEPMIDVGETEGAEIDLDSPKVVEEKEELDVVQEEQTASGEEQKEETKEENKEDELGEYSESVKKRIAKLTRKMREAERQKEEAIAYAHSIAQKQKQLETRYKDLDTNYVSEFENRVQSNLEAAKIKLKNAIDNQDVDGQIAARPESDQKKEDQLHAQGAGPAEVTGIDVLHGFEQPLMADEEGGNLVIRDLLVKDYPILLRVSQIRHIFLPTVLRGAGG